MFSFRSGRKQFLALFLCGSLCLFFGWFILGFLKSTSIEPEHSQVEVLVASKHIPYGTHLENPELFFKKQKFPPDQLSAEALTDYDQVKNFYLKKELQEGACLTAKNLTDNNWTLVQPAGTVAFEIEPASIEYIGALCYVVGNQYDLVVQSGQGDNVEYTVLVEKVLALGHDFVSLGEGREKSVVVMALKHEDVQKVKAARSKGPIHLSHSQPEAPVGSSLPRLTLADLLKQLGKEEKEK